MTILESTNGTWRRNSKGVNYSFKFGYHCVFYLVFMLSENINHMQNLCDPHG